MKVRWLLIALSASPIRLLLNGHSAGKFSLLSFIEVQGLVLQFITQRLLTQDRDDLGHVQIINFDCRGGEAPRRPFTRHGAKKHERGWRSGL